MLREINATVTNNFYILNCLQKYSSNTKLTSKPICLACLLLSLELATKPLSHIEQAHFSAENIKFGLIYLFIYLFICLFFLCYMMNKRIYECI